jgi:hypothetical protein
MTENKNTKHPITTRAFLRISKTDNLVDTLLSLNKHCHIEYAHKASKVQRPLI